MIKRFDVFEEIVKEVTPFGNGSIVYTPKKWIGQTVRVILEKEPLNIKESTMELLQPFLEQVKGVFLAGSFARNEQMPDSDIDVLVVSGKKFSLPKSGRFDFTIIDEEILRNELNGKDPFYIYSLLQEAKPILNERLLKELREIKINKRGFRWAVEESESALRIVKEFLEFDKLQKRKKLDSTAVIYSMILRFRGIFFIQCLSRNEKYSNKGFKSFLNKKGLPEELIDSFYEIYRSERDGKKANAAVSIEDTERLYQLVTDELRKLKQVLKCRQKRNAQRE
jgi:predicted nucleotidyltransferase